jgi:arylsulfatase A-like enzyme
MLPREVAMASLLRALALGAGFGVAAAVVELWVGLIPFIQRRMGPGPLALAESGLWMIALGAVLGLLGAPLLLRVRRRAAGTLLLVAWLAGAWYALERWVELDSPLFAPAMLARPFGGALVLLLGLGLRSLPRVPAWAPWAAGALLFAGGVYAPGVYLSATTPAPPLRAALAPALPGAPDIVLVVLDTVRAENVSTYGHARDTAPTLDALAREGALFLDATSPSTWSLPSHASLFTGRYPSSHGAYAFRTLLDDRFPTLAQVLQAKGFETFCFTANPWISDGLGLTRGFGYQDDSWRASGGRGFSFIHRLGDRLGFGAYDKGGGMVAERFEAWARARPASARPAFAFLNFLEAHFPYHELPPEYRSRYTDRPLAELRRVSMDLMAVQFGGPSQDPALVGPPARDLYDGGVRYSDALLGRVVEALRARGTLDRTVLVVLADHGELLGEHGSYFGHGPSLYQKAIRVPLLVRYPARVPAGARVEAPVTTLGAFATIVELAGLEVPPTVQAGSLLPLLAPGAEGADAGAPFLAELMSSGVPTAERGDPQIKANVHLRALRAGRMKLVESSAGDRFLYDLEADPLESRDLAAERPEEAAALHARLEAERARLGLPAFDQIGRGAAAAVDEETKQRLRELGYVEE